MAKGKEVVTVSQDAPVKAPYSPALKVEGTRWLFCSGQLGVDSKTGNLLEGIEAQTAQALENLKGLVEAAGGTLADVVKVTVFLADMGDFAKMNEVYRRYLPQPFPTRSTVQVAGLAREARVEIECVAILG